MRDLVPHGERDGEGARQAVGTGDLVLERGRKAKSMFIYYMKSNSTVCSKYDKIFQHL